MAVRPPRSDADKTTTPRRIEVDPAFKGSGVRWQRRRARRRLLRIAGGLGAVAALSVAGVVGYLAFLQEPVEFEDDDAVLIQSEATADTGVLVAAAGAEAFLDIRGEPLILVLPEGAATGRRTFFIPREVHPLRAAQGAELTLIDDVLVEPGERVRISIPSSSADLASFQAQRSSAFSGSGAVPGDRDQSASGGEVGSGKTVTVEDGEASWGTVVGGGDQAGAGQLSYVQTVIENTTTSISAKPSSERAFLFRDVVRHLEETGTLREALVQIGASEAEADRVVSNVLRLSSLEGVPQAALETLEKGSVLAVRLDRNRRDANILQMTVYTPQRRLLSIAQPGPGRFELSADPWIDKQLIDQATRVGWARSSEGEARLKDAVYSAALRNRMPTDLVGEMMVMLSKTHNLDKIAGAEDRMTILFNAEGRGAPAARLLFVGLEVGDRKMQCYVVSSENADAPYECLDPTQRVSVSVPGAARLAGGFTTPVAGTKTSGFGPRNHPILKKIVNHNGVDWAAPTGTPVHAAGAGKVTRADFSGSYGNVVYIEHSGGMETRYAHLNGFAAGLAVGAAVQSGELIGYVGSTGRSTGPHLHFELRQGGTPVDPLGQRVAVGPASGAVEALVNRIIQVESAGNARAKNPLSSATGLGQFISSTWIRMMNTYRPDLVASLSRQELLNLRFDPALSRAMVTNLARENEAFLRARGHQISAGRLYLAHFLGPAGAHTALSADPNATVLSVMGAAVVNANPFLKGKTVSWMTQWSDRKMRSASGRAGSVVTSAPRVLSPDVKRFKEALDQTLTALLEQ